MKLNGPLKSELEQLEYYNEYLTNECQKKILSLIYNVLQLETETKTTEKGFCEIGNKNNMNRPATLHEILLVKSSASKNKIEKHYHKLCLLMHSDVGGDKEFFKTINRAYQILKNDAAR